MKLDNHNFMENLNIRQGRKTLKLKLKVQGGEGAGGSRMATMSLPNEKYQCTYKYYVFMYIIHKYRKKKKISRQ